VGIHYPWVSSWVDGRPCVQEVDDFLQDDCPFVLAQPLVSQVVSRPVVFVRDLLFQALTEALGGLQGTLRVQQLVWQERQVVQHWLAVHWAYLGQQQV
jgi:hypothetical protein